MRSRVSTITAKWVVALLGALIGTMACPARSAGQAYRVALTANAGRTTTAIDCFQGALCQGQINLQFGQTIRPIAFVALLEPGNAYVRFAVDEIPLLAGSSWYFHLPLGQSNRGHATAVVSLPSRQVLADRNGTLVKRPVLRAGSAVLGTIDLDVRSRD